MRNTTLSRRSLLGATAGLAAISVAGPVRPARAAEITLKWGHPMPLQHPVNLRAMEAVEKIRQQTGGRVDIQVFPDNQLGGDSDMTNQVRNGAIHFYTAAGVVIGPLVPAIGIINMAFAFKDYDQVWKAMDGEVGAAIRVAFEKVNLYTFGRMWDNGFRQITSAPKPIKTPEDLRGFKIRVPNSPILISLFKSLQASPTSMNVNEVYAALQTRVVDGQENPLTVTATRNFNEVQKYCAVTNHSWDGFVQVANMAGWKKLPADIQEIITRNFDAAAVAQRDDTKALNESLRAQLESKGMVFNVPEMDPFRADLKKSGFYQEWQKKYPPELWAKLEQYVGNLSG
jgi:tripartite ATP-independent transporter DctP family solute receptor